MSDELTDEQARDQAIPPKRAAAMDEGDRLQGVPSYEDPVDEKAPRSARPKDDAGLPEEEPKKKAPAKKDSSKKSSGRKKPAAKKSPAKKSEAKKS